MKIKFPIREVIIKYPNEDFCVISHESLLDRSYEECYSCRKPFLIEYLMDWLNIKYICPACQKVWLWSDNTYYYKKLNLSDFSIFQ